MKDTDRDLSTKLTHSSTDALVALVDSKSRDGDFAIAELKRRIDHRALADLVVEKRIKTALGKIRIMTTLHQAGSSDRYARTLESLLLEDRSSNVVSEALFGLVFSNSTKILPRLIELKSRSTDPERQELLGKAISALEKGDPSVYSPHFSDENKVWNTDG